MIPPAIPMIMMKAAVAAVLLLAGCRPSAPLTAPAAYLVGLAGPVTVSSGWWTKETAAVHPLAASRQYRLPAGAQAVLIHADGRTELQAGPVEITVPAPSSSLAFTGKPFAEWIPSLKAPPPPPPGLTLVLSPVGVTRHLAPMLHWTTEPGKNYDVAIRDPEDGQLAPRIALDVVPPVSTSELSSHQTRPLRADRIYEVLIRESGADSFSGGGQFLIAPTATADNLPGEPGALLAEAASALAARPARTGDAWMALRQLPAAWADSELGLRLRLHAAAELGAAADYTEALRLAEKRLAR
jgi:hypothetical protein